MKNIKKRLCGAVSATHKRYIPNAYIFLNSSLRVRITAEKKLAKSLSNCHDSKEEVFWGNCKHFLPPVNVSQFITLNLFEDSDKQTCFLDPQSNFSTNLSENSQNFSRELCSQGPQTPSCIC